MKFLDEAVITIESGAGGKGCVGFRREKYIPEGGPDGGDGGKGGDVIFVADRNLTTLLDFQYKRHHKACSGGKGEGKLRTGAGGENLIIHVPVGTLIEDFKTKEILADLATTSQTYLALMGGRGGKGNHHFKTSIRQAPQRAQPGESGQTKEIVLELKLLADVGIIGLPNVGKSTLLSKISNSKPKIADYPFTTLSPNLGVVRVEGQDSGYVVADIPGLVEGAHKGVGLGIMFLKHIERTKLFWHVIDASHSSPVDALHTIHQELQYYNPKLLKKKQIVILNKTDLLTQLRVTSVKKQLQKEGYPVIAVCALKSQGIDDLLNLTIRELQ